MIFSGTDKQAVFYESSKLYTLCFCETFEFGRVSCIRFRHHSSISSFAGLRTSKWVCALLFEKLYTYIYYLAVTDFGDALHHDYDLNHLKCISFHWIIWVKNVATIWEVLCSTLTCISPFEQNHLTQIQLNVMLYHAHVFDRRPLILLTTVPIIYHLILWYVCVVCCFPPLFLVIWYFH